MTDEQLRQRHLDAVGMAARLTDSGRVALASQFGQDAVPIIAMGICLGVFNAAAAGTMLCRVASLQGTKGAGATWTLTHTVTVTT